VVSVDRGFRPVAGVVPVLVLASPTMAALFVLETIWRYWNHGRFVVPRVTRSRKRRCGR